MPARPTPLRVIAWPRWARALAGTLTALAFALLLYVALLLVLDTFDGELRAPPRNVTLAVLFFTVIPRLLVEALRFLFRATLETTPTHWRLEHRSLSVEIPLSAIASFTFWRLPLPGPGFSLRLASGRPFERTFEGTPPPDAPPLTGRTAAFARARHARHRSDLRAYLLKFVLFPLLPIAVLFRTHQVITFGGPFGQWSLVGPEAWLRSLFEHGAVTLAHLLVFAGALRVCAELFAVLATAARPASAIRIRQIAEWGVRLGYYVAIPALIGIAFLL